MANLAPNFDAANKPNCPACGGEVIRVEGGRMVESCRAGTGRVALQTFVLGGQLRAELVNMGTGFRFHRCPRGLEGEQAFSAAARPRKRRPGAA